eukprot:scaffold1356_cov123-Cylindrotheca_fusiformis.AAC.17
MVVASETRVCIKNFPPNTTEDDLKDFLVKSSKVKLEITDCKVLKNSKGKSRKVAFVGFRHADQASSVVKSFDKSFLRMSRLSVERALAKMDENPSEVVSAPVETKGKNGKEKSIAEKLAFAESGKKGSKFWGNDEVGVTAHGSPVKEDTQSSASTSSSSSSDTSDSEDDMEVDAAAGKAEAKAPVISDMDFLRSKQADVADLAEAEEEEDGANYEVGASSSSSDSDDSDSSSDADKDVDEKPKESQGQTDIGEQQETEEGESDEHGDDPMEQNSQNRLFVRNLPFGTTEEELAEYFSSFGKVSECHIPMDDQMKNNKGFAFVAFVSAADAFEAKAQLDKKDFQGRLLHILQARPAPSAPKIDDPNLSWKQRKELARKERETKNGGASQGWSASFVRGDAVIDSLADKLGLRKGEILGVKDKLSSGDAAVRLALAETQIIEENRQYFKQHGVDMDALVSANGERDVKRSKTSILVKNLPYDTRVAELIKLFQMGEASLEILLPPSRSIALVKYGHSADAKRAFRKLAYRRFKHVPIYLEWAPLSASIEPSSTTNTSSGENAGTTLGPVPTPATIPHQAEIKTSEALEDDDELGTTTGASTTIYVKNLSFQTTEEALRRVFEKAVGDVRFVRIPRKIAPIKQNQEEVKSLSMGFGFVELPSEALAEKAIKKLSGGKTTVDGHTWELSISASKTNKAQPVKQTGGKNPTKLVVRNVPFQATRTELLKLFGSFGQLRKVRLPKKFDGSHRGFAFVEFLTSNEAQAAMTSLSRTHLYGRHLVLEWATNDDQNVDMLREKAKRDTSGSTIPAQPQNKRIKFDD